MEEERYRVEGDAAGRRDGDRDVHQAGLVRFQRDLWVVFDLDIGGNEGRGGEGDRQVRDDERGIEGIRSVQLDVESIFTL